MHRQAFDTLEFERLKEMLWRQARTPLGAARVAELTTSDDLEEIHRERVDSLLPLPHVENPALSTFAFPPFLPLF